MGRGHVLKNAIWQQGPAVEDIGGRFIGVDSGWKGELENPIVKQINNQLKDETQGEEKEKKMRPGTGGTVKARGLQSDASCAVMMLNPKWLAGVMSSG
jgi:hypothetical protein